MTAPSRLLRRIATFNSTTITIYVDDVPLRAHEGETVLAAILLQTTFLRCHEVDATPRAGFCLMGSCQDCWVWFSGGTRGRACTTSVRDGMRVLTTPPALP